MLLAVRVCVNRSILQLKLSGDTYALQRFSPGRQVEFAIDHDQEQ